MKRLSQIYAEEAERCFRERERVERRDELIKYARAYPMQKAQYNVAEWGAPLTHDDLDYIEHRVYHDYVGTVDYDIRDPNHTEGEGSKAWLPYEQDMSEHPEVFRQYQENNALFYQVKQTFENEDPMVEQGENPFTRRMPKDMSRWEKHYDDLMPKNTDTLCE